MKKKEIYSLLNTLVFFLMTVTFAFVLCYFVYSDVGKESIWFFFKKNADGIVMILAPVTLLLIIVSYLEREK